MRESEFFKRVVFNVMLLTLIIFACRLTNGWVSLIIAVIGAVSAIRGRVAGFVTCYLLLPFMVMLNPFLIGTGHNFYVLTRFGNFILISSAIFRWASGAGRGRAHFPIGLLFLYLGIACLSSAIGWFPLISYLKLFNFILFLVGIYCSVCDMQTTVSALNQVRVIFMAFAVLVILGSLVLLPIPGIAYLTSARNMLRAGAEFADINAAMAEKTGVRLFTGIVNQSQALGPMTVCLTGWVLCDMLFVVRKFSKLHLVIILLSPIVLYLTRSRTAMVSFAMIVCILFFYSQEKVRMPLRMKNALRRLFCGFAVALILAAGVAEIKSGAMTRWLRKNDDMFGDKRDFVEAVTSSRMNQIEMMMQDYHRNPLLGMGFQVSEDIPYRYQEGTVSIMSASVEKGNVFLVVLSECGIIGAIVFGAFLVRFYLFCDSKRYMALMTLFTGFLATNLGEATFFSPTAMGGILWMIAVVGGFAIDLSSKRRTEMEMMTGRF